MTKFLLGMLVGLLLGGGRRIDSVLLADGKRGGVYRSRDAQPDQAAGREGAAPFGFEGCGGSVFGCSGSSQSAGSALRAGPFARPHF